MQKFTEVNTEGAVSKFLFQGLVLVDSGDPEAALQAYDKVTQDRVEAEPLNRTPQGEEVLRWS